MSTIIYYASDENMGDTPSEDCAKFRAWADAQLKAEYPHYDIDVRDEQSTVTAWTDDIDREDEISDYCSRLWDNCPWNF